MEIVFAAKSEALGDTLNIIDMNIFEQAVDILAGAGRIVQIALRDVLIVSGSKNDRPRGDIHYEIG
jgi:DNA-binding MurR/RpiR family transcriptional regulator